MEYAPTADTIGKDYAVVDTVDGARRRWSSELRAAGRFALRVLPDAPSAMRAGIVGLVVLDRAAAGALRAARRDPGAPTDLFGAPAAALDGGLDAARRSRR